MNNEPSPDVHSPAAQHQRSRRSSVGIVLAVNDRTALHTHTALYASSVRVQRDSTPHKTIRNHARCRRL
jgi:hypothetical protein